MCPSAEITPYLLAMSVYPSHKAFLSGRDSDVRNA